MNSGVSDRVIVPREAAQIAYGELERLVERTGGPEIDAADATTPMGLLRQRIEADDQLDSRAKWRVLKLLQEVAAERGIGISDADPLTDATFRAKSDLGAALSTDASEYVVGEPIDGDEEDIFQEELTDVAHGMVTTAFIFETDGRGLTGFKVNSDDIEWCDFQRQGAQTEA